MTILNSKADNPQQNQCCELKTSGLEALKI